MIRRLSALAVIFACSITLSSQATNSERDERSYSGVGRISWQHSQAIPTIFAVPHFTAGPRLLCKSSKIECEINVLSRDISIPFEDRIDELMKQVAPDLKNATVKTFQAFHHGKNGAVTYTTLEDSRRGEQFRFLTVGFATRGTAVLKFHAVTNSALDYEGVLNIVYQAKALDAQEMWALRFADYIAICAERFPEFTEVNSNALQSSRLSSVNTVEFIKRNRPELTTEAAERKLLDGRKGYAKSFDMQSIVKQRQFCQRIPDFLATATSEL